jgi:toxin YoeB
MRDIRFDPDAWREFTDWNTRDRKTWLKIVDLIDEITRTPFEGVSITHK